MAADRKASRFRKKATIFTFTNENNACQRYLSGWLWLSSHVITLLPHSLTLIRLSFPSLFNTSLFPWLAVLSSFTQIIMLGSVPVPEGGSSDTALHVYPEVSFNKYLNLGTLSNSEPGDKMMHLCSPSLPQPSLLLSPSPLSQPPLSLRANCFMQQMTHKALELATFTQSFSYPLMSSKLWIFLHADAHQYTHWHTQFAVLTLGPPRCSLGCGWCRWCWWTEGVESRPEWREKRVDPSCPASPRPGRSVCIPYWGSGGDLWSSLLLLFGLLQMNLLHLWQKIQSFNIAWNKMKMKLNVK